MLVEAVVPSIALCATCIADLVIVVNPSYHRWSGFDNGELVLQRLDYDNLRIVNSCLAQTVNLQYYEAKVGAACFHLLSIHPLTLLWYPSAPHPHPHPSLRIRLCRSRARCGQCRFGLVSVCAGGRTSQDAQL
jgi:hypothetical protein